MQVGYIMGGRRSDKTLAMQLAIDEARNRGEHVVIMDETIPEPVKPVDPTLPMRLSLDPNSPDFHPSYMRVGLRIDGKERNDIQFYDVKRLEYMTTALSSHSASSIEPYWRYDENRQQRRARERWEGKRK